MADRAAIISRETVRFSADGVTLEGELTIPTDAIGLVLFAHGSGSSRHSPRNRYVAGVLNDAGIATFLFDLLTQPEEEVDRRTAHLRFDISLLAQRVSAATDWAKGYPATRDYHVGYFGASTGAAAALVAASNRKDVAAVVSRGGRPDLAGEALPRVKAPTLLIVGGDDHQVIGMNRSAQIQLQVENQLRIIPGAGHLFEEHGALEEVATLAAEWFEKYMR